MQPSDAHRGRGLRDLPSATQRRPSTPHRFGGGSAFVLLGLPCEAGFRESWLLQLLLPYLHLAQQRIATAVQAPVLTPAVSPRQAEILQWLREGKSNEEIGRLLGISALTVKNHLQRLYRQLGVSNRTHAVARSVVQQHG